MSAFVKTFVTLGLNGYEVTIEADMNRALPTIEIIGLPDAAVKESKERIRSTFRNLGIELPPRKILLNLAPSDVKKTGTQFDVPMATAILFLIAEIGCRDDTISRSLFFGELGLDGSIKRINGILPAAIAAKKHGYTHFFVPAENAYELSCLPDIMIFPLSSFQDIVHHFQGEKLILPYLHAIGGGTPRPPAPVYTSDFSTIKGHRIAKRALSIAAAGFHNIVLIGAPGSGKSLLANALSSILPPLLFDEMIEISGIYSLLGKLTKEEPLVTHRPFRRIHHTASKIAIVGGGAMLQPGEISLAHKGVLFFDELPEFPREVLEVLRQPLEDKRITISRAIGSVSYPAEYMFVAAMNPCPCGYFKDPDKTCSCSSAEIMRYQAKISGPLLDRIDMLLEVPREHVDVLFEKQTASDDTLSEGVVTAWQTQQKRYVGTTITNNAGLSAKDVERYIILEEKAESFLKQAAQKLHFSGRIIHRMLKLSRTIADIEGSEIVGLAHVAEAMQYRSKTMFMEKS